MLRLLKPALKEFIMKKAAVIIVCYFISIFISNFVAARELKVRWFDGVIPGGNMHMEL